jgi:hypothetical protein
MMITSAERNGKEPFDLTPLQKRMATTSESEGAFAFACLLFLTFVIYVAPQAIFPFLEPLHLAFVSAVLGIGAYMLDLAWNTLWKQVRLPLGASLVMTGVVLTIQYLTPTVTVGERPVRIVCASGGGIIAYCGSIYWRGGLIVDELREMSGWFFRSRQQTTVGK